MNFDSVQVNPSGLSTLAVSLETEIRPGFLSAVHHKSTSHMTQILSRTNKYWIQIHQFFLQYYFLLWRLSLKQWSGQSQSCFFLILLLQFLQVSEHEQDHNWPGFAMMYRIKLESRPQNPLARHTSKKKKSIQLQCTLCSIQKKMSLKRTERISV